METESNKMMKQEWRDCIAYLALGSLLADILSFFFLEVPVGAIALWAAPAPKELWFIERSDFSMHSLKFAGLADLF